MHEYNEHTVWTLEMIGYCETALHISLSLRVGDLLIDIVIEVSSIHLHMTTCTQRMYTFEQIIVYGNMDDSMSEPVPFPMNDSVISLRKYLLIPGDSREHQIDPHSDLYQSRRHARKWQKKIHAPRWLSASAIRNPLRIPSTGQICSRFADFHRPSALPYFSNERSDTPLPQWDYSLSSCDHIQYARHLRDDLYCSRAKVPQKHVLAFSLMTTIFHSSQCRVTMFSYSTHDVCGKSGEKDP